MGSAALLAPGHLVGRLREAYGSPPPSPLLAPGGDPLELLVLTLLSQATGDSGAALAYRRLRERFPGWADVARADTEEVAAAIAPGGLSRRKAPRIQAILRCLHAERGAYSLDFLRGLPSPEAYSRLTDFPGVGPKTAACVLLFAFGAPHFPADVHILRVAERAGLIGRGGAGEAQDALAVLFAPAEYLALHLYLILHGRTVCRPRPKCPDCCLRAGCAAGGGAGRSGAGRIQSEAAGGSGTASRLTTRSSPPRMDRTFNR